MGALV
ncbi:hypothetical protein LINPERHAP2_LOCUS3923 [Linum perenne]